MKPLHTILFPSNNKDKEKHPQAAMANSQEEFGATLSCYQGCRCVIGLGVLKPSLEASQHAQQVLRRWLHSLLAKILSEELFSDPFTA